MASQPWLSGLVRGGVIRSGFLGVQAVHLPGQVPPVGAGQGHGVIPGPGQLRFRRVNITKPHQPDFFRKKLLAYSKPVWDEIVPLEDEPKNCGWVEKQEEAVKWNDHVNQLEVFYVREMMELFHSSQMIAFYHTNPISNGNFRKAWQNGRRSGMELKRFSMRVGRNGLRGTEWENCLHFFHSFPGDMNEQPILFSPEVNPKALLTFEKKVPEFHLLGAVVHGRILSRAGVMELQNIPDLTAQREQLVALLGANQGKLVQLLGSNQQQLATNLEQLIKDKTE
eukprot:TRINITY_DN5707_c0_g1_i2.p1 TRINITY_DN5707_c0_g1~~TRINITY_DN5707_c0_g1_i2.p1  ORF type:complete len:281 (-),score=76.64 TRINITY_DN5707_c0_g1_i2:28-870(-)